jgi:mono/diheme cytochrome c family protein
MTISAMWNSTAVALLVVAVVVATVALFGATQSASAAAATAVANRGLYVAQASDCASCHTSPGGKPFAGGTPLKTPFGTIYGSNVTPDTSSGIGDWSEADFDRALRRGVRKDGSYLYPAMPYGNYTKMTAEDMHALWLYMRGLAPVHNVVPKNTLPFPLSVRSSVLVWQSLYFKPGEFQPEPKESAQWNRGAYLVEALGHCDQCHTPRNAAQGLRTDRQLTGAEIEGWYAPDISGDALSKLREWSERDLARFFKTGIMPGNTKAAGPMQEVVHESLSHLGDPDLNAMAVYLKEQTSNSRPPAAPSPDKWPRQADAQALYREQCGACHQNDGRGIAGTVPALAHNDAVTAAEPSNVVMAMLEGFPAQGSWGAMGSFASSLSDEQIADVANYVRTAWGNAAAPNATPWAVASWRKNYAEAPKSGPRALLCPDLRADAMKPALAVGPQLLQQAASSPGKMSQLVHNYEAAVPNASSGEVIEALSTAYCRALADTAISEPRMSAQIADFAQRVAISEGGQKPM